jgi:hypothetical protein
VRRFNFQGPEAAQALVMVSYQLDFLLDYLDQPALLKLPLNEQMELITAELVKSKAIELDHALCTLALCFIRLLEARHASTPQERPDT